MERERCYFIFMSIKLSRSDNTNPLARAVLAGFAGMEFQFLPSLTEFHLTNLYHFKTMYPDERMNGEVWLRRLQ